MKKASDQLHRSRSAVSHAIGELESALGIELFERNARGMLPNEFGKILQRRTHFAFSEMRTARKTLEDMASLSNTRLRNAPIFTLSVNSRRLQVLIAFAQRKHMGAVATLLDISQPAVSMAIRDLDLSTGLPLFERSGNTVRLTRAGEVLLAHTRRAMSQLRLVAADIAMLKGNIEGSIHVGALPYGGGALLPQAIARLVSQYPQLTVTTSLGPFERLAAALWHGDIDLVVGALQPVGHYTGLLSEKLFDDPIVIVARNKHPLLQKKTLQLADVLNESWVLPRKGTPTRHALEQALLAKGLPLPHVMVESSDPSTIRGLLLESNLITAVAQRLFQYELNLSSLVILPVDPPAIHRSIGILTRTHEHSSPAAQLLKEEIRKAGGAQADT